MNTIESYIHFTENPLLISIIIILFSFSLLFLSLGLRKVKKHIIAKIAVLKSFGDSAAIDRKDFVKIKEEFLKDQVLSHQWREFEECVVLDQKNDFEEYRNTIAASEFFNFDDVVNTSNTWIFNIKFNFFNVVPNLLTGLGILGTFVGIIQGLSKSTADSNSPLDIDMFIEGLHTSFGTSICGLLLATIFTFYEKLKMDRAEHFVNELAQEVDRLFKRKVEQEYLNDIHRSLEEQNASIKTLASQIGEQIVKSFAGGGINTVDVSNTIKDSIAAGFEQLNDNLKNINEAHTAYQERAQNILDGSKDVGLAITYLNKAVDGYTDSLISTTSKFESVGDKLQNINEQQLQQINSFGESTNNIIQAANTTNESINSLIKVKEDFQISFTQTSTRLNEMVSEFTNLVENYNGQNLESITNTFKAFDQELAKIVTNLSKGTSGISEGVDNMAYYLSELKKDIDQAKLPALPNDGDDS